MGNPSVGRAGQIMLCIYFHCKWVGSSPPGQEPTQVQSQPHLTNHKAQLLCSIEKAVWKVAQNGLSTEAKIYYYRFVYTSTFFFKRPYLGNETRFFKCVSAKILVSSRAFIHSFMKVTSPNSFILFRPLSWKKAHFRGVPGGPNWATPVQNMPLGPLLMVKKKIYGAS